MKKLFINGIGHGKFQSENDIEEYLLSQNIVRNWQYKIKIVDVEEYQQDLQKKSHSNKWVNDHNRSCNSHDNYDKNDVWDFVPQKPIALLNSAIMTDFGTFKLTPLSLNEARELVHKRGFFSHVGHDSTCCIMGELLSVVGINQNRTQYHQKIGDTAIVFKLKGRPEEGKILSIEEIEAIGYEFAILERLA